MTPFRSPWPDVPLREVTITDRLFEGLVQAPDAVVLIAAFLRCELTCSKQPLRIDCNEAVPKSASGKILRLVSKDQILKQTGQNGTDPGRPRKTLSPDPSLLDPSPPTPLPRARRAQAAPLSAPLAASERGWGRGGTER